MLQQSGEKIRAVRLSICQQTLTPLLSNTITQHGSILSEWPFDFCYFMSSDLLFGYYPTAYVVSKSQDCRGNCLYLELTWLQIR